MKRSLPLLLANLVLLAVFLPGRSAKAADALLYGVIKTQLYTQAVSAVSASPLPANGFVFDALVIPTTNYSITNAILGTPSSQQIPLHLVTNGTALIFQQAFSSQSAMDGTYPGPSAGTITYGMTMYAVHDGVPNGSASYAPSFFGASYPPVPEPNNLPAAQSIDNTRDCTFTWIINGSTSANDGVQFVIRDYSSNNVFFASPFPFTSNALNGLSDTVTVPYYSLPAGSNLVGDLTIVRVAGSPNTNAYPGATGAAALAINTSFPVATRPAAVPPVLRFTQKHAPFQVSYTGEANRIYHLLSATNLVNPAWTNLTNFSTSSGSYTDSNSLHNSRTFYRMQVGP